MILSKSIGVCHSLHGGPLPTRQRLSCLVIAACFVSADAFALPVGAQVVNGTATIAQAGNVLTVTNSNGAIINWQQFNINAGQTARFIQPSASSSVLNRVLASDPSVILGNITSNGKVWLINPAGIYVGQGARIDTAAFVASTLNVTNADFLANRLKFDANLGAGSVVNQGQITTPMGGSVYLIGSNVTNEGIITTPKGETILAAGQKVELIDSATPGVKVEITGAEGNVTNLGEITAQAGRIGIAGVVVRNSGRLNASSVVEEGGRIFLRATKKIELTDSSRVGADGTAGGSVTAITSENGQISGELVARGEISAQGNGTPGIGGFIETSASTVDVSGLVVKASGGEWLIDPFNYTIDATAASTIKGALDGGASVTIDTTNNTDPGAGGAGVGDITVTSAISKTAGADATLTLNAHNNINLNANITSTTGQLNMVFNPDSDSTGGGAVVLGTTTLDANGGTINAAGKTVSHSTGTATINSAMTIGTLNLTGDTLTGTGSINMGANSTVTQTEATLAINTFNLPVTATYNISNTTGPGGAVPFFVPTTFNNSGTVNWNGTAQQRTPSGARTFNNLSGGQFNILNNEIWDTCCSGGSITFNNNAGASITKSSTGTTTLSGAITLNNSGTLNISAGTFTMSGTGGTTNSGTITSAGTLNLGSNWSNSGTLEVTGTGVLNLGGSFTSTGLGTITHGSGSVNVTGTLTNAGSLNIGSGGAFGGLGLTSLTGTIVGGTLTNSDASPILTTNTNFTTGGTLDGVTVGSNLTANGELHINNSLTLASGVTMTAGTNQWLRFKTAGAQSIVTPGTATIILTGGGIHQQANAQTLTIGGGITVNGKGGVGAWDGTNKTLINQGTIDANLAGQTLTFGKPDNVSVVNNGTLRASAGVLDISGPIALADLGAFSRTGGTVTLSGTVNLGGGTLDIGGTGLFGAGGLTLFTGTLKNGTLVSNDGTVFNTSGPRILDGVTIGSNLTVNGELNIFNNLTLSGGTTLNKGASHWYFNGYDNGGKPAGTVHHLATTGAATVNSTGGNIYIHANNGGQTLQVDSGVTLQGPLTLTNYWPGNTIVNAGTINATSGTTTINPTTFTNSGTIALTGGTLNLGHTDTAAGLATTLGAGHFTRSAGTTLTWSGTLDNTGNTLDIGGAGLFKGGLSLFTGVIKGGTLVSNDGTSGSASKVGEGSMQRVSSQRSHPSATPDWERLIRTVARNLHENRPQPPSSAQARASTPELAHLRRR